MIYIKAMAAELDGGDTIKYGHKLLRIINVTELGTNSVELKFVFDDDPMGRRPRYMTATKAQVFECRQRGVLI